MFKRLDVVVIDGGSIRYCVEAIREGYVGEEFCAVADLSDENGVRITVRTERLTKVGG